VIVDKVALVELDIDVRMRELWALAEQEEEWSLETAASYMRAAFACGYFDALKEPERERGRLCREPWLRGAGARRGVSDVAQARAERDDRWAADLLPACARCGDVAEHGARKCEGCGANLLPGKALLAAAKREGGAR